MQTRSDSAHPLLTTSPSVINAARSAACTRSKSRLFGLSGRAAELVPGTKAATTTAAVATIRKRRFDTKNSLCCTPYLGIAAPFGFTSRSPVVYVVDPGEERKNPSSGADASCPRPLGVAMSRSAHRIATATSSAGISSAISFEPASGGTVELPTACLADEQTQIQGFHCDLGGGNWSGLTNAHRYGVIIASAANGKSAVLPPPTRGVPRLGKPPVAATRHLSHHSAVETCIFAGP